MSTTRDSRLNLSDTIQPVNIVTRQPNAPAFLDLRQRISQDSTDSFLTVSFTSWPLTGKQLYGVAGRWWASADVSNVVDPFTELPAGNTVRAPTAERLLFDVLRL